MATANIGIVSPVVKRAWNETDEYERLNIVNGSDGATYQAIQHVPADTDPTDSDNAEYWMQITPKAPTITAEDVAFDAGATVVNTGTAMAPAYKFQVPRGVTGNESIDDTAGEGDDDVVWSAGKTFEELKKTALVESAVYISNTTTYQSFNDLEVGKVYYVSSGANLSNAPYKTGLNLMVFSMTYRKSTGNYIAQIAISFSEHQKNLFIRTKTQVAGSWSEWKTFSPNSAYRSRFNGRKVSIIGDSIETWNSPAYKIDGYAYYYPNTNVPDITNINQTWWKQVLDASGAVIEVNASYSGSRATDTDSDRPSFYDRVSLLGEPDVIFVTLGINDSANNVPLGEYDYETAYTELSESTFRTAYIKGIKALKELYPEAQIICVNKNAASAYVESIAEIAKTLGVEFINANIYSKGYGSHPDALGMMQIASQVLYPTDERFFQRKYPADAYAVGKKLEDFNQYVGYRKKISDTEGEDLDNYKTNGIWSFYSPTNIAHRPDGITNGILIVFDGNNYSSTPSGWVNQIVLGSNKLNAYKRTLSGGSWTEWKQFSFMEDNLQSITLTEAGTYEPSGSPYAVCRDGNMLYIGYGNKIEKVDISNPSAPVKINEHNYGNIIDNGRYTISEHSTRFTRILKHGNYLFCSMRYAVDGLTDMFGEEAEGKNFGGLMICNATNLSVVKVISLPYKCCWVDILGDTCVLTRMHYGFTVYSVDNLLSDNEVVPLFVENRELVSHEYHSDPEEWGSYETTLDNQLEYQSACLWEKKEIVGEGDEAVEEVYLYCTFGLHRGGISTWDFTDISNAHVVDHYNYRDDLTLSTPATRLDLEGVEHEIMSIQHYTYNAVVSNGKVFGAVGTGVSIWHGGANDKSGLVVSDALDLTSPQFVEIPTELIPPKSAPYKKDDIGPTFVGVYHDSAVINLCPYGLAVFSKLPDSDKYVFVKQVPLDNDGASSHFITIGKNILVTTARLSGKQPKVNVIRIGV